MEVTGSQSWRNYIGPKRGKGQVCLTKQCLHPFPSRWRGLESPLLRIEHGGLGVKCGSSKYILANMNCVYDISMESQLTNLFIDIFVFKMTKLRDVQICHEVKKPYLHYTFLKLKISAIIKDPHLKFYYPFLIVVRREGCLRFFI